jgi:phosphoribosylaminoimidazolecarboxamide formyltransferase/IMP cyclohydrolase
MSARYRWAVDLVGWWDSAVIHSGKAMSYLNVLDTEAAWRLVHELGDEPAAVVVKHTNPCGVAIADNIGDAWVAAHECDPVSSFGGIVALNRPVTMAVAGPLSEVFTEVVVAPSYEADALDVLRARTGLRILEAQPPGMLGLDLRPIDGGFLAQDPDPVDESSAGWTVVTRREPSEVEWVDLMFAWRVVARVSSNAVVLARGRHAVGIGAGQQNRRDAVRLAAEKADGRAVKGVCASDAFFPFSDGLDAAIDAGVTAVVQPGGSVRDDEVVAAADAAGLAMVFTGSRHFRH